MKLSFERPCPNFPVWLIRQDGLIVGKIRSLPAGVLVNLPGVDLGGVDLFGNPVIGLRACKTVTEAKKLVKGALRELAHQNS